MVLTRSNYSLGFERWIAKSDKENENFVEEWGINADKY